MRGGSPQVRELRAPSRALRERSPDASSEHPDEWIMKAFRTGSGVTRPGEQARSAPLTPRAAVGRLM
jgi:hypothetical protein